MQKEHKKIFVTKPFIPDIKEYNVYLEKIWKNQWLTNKGPIYKEFEEKLKKFLNSENICLTVNGHSALDIAIKSFNLKGEVITTPFTFASTTHAITMNGLTPIFCDIKEDDLTIDENKIESLITDKTCAIVAVHVYGHICNIEKIEQIARKHNLVVIYDAAHCFGINYNGRSIAAYGDASIFSFHATKVFNSIEGGCIVYKDKNKKIQLNSLRNFGIYSEDVVDYVGINAKMNEFQAAMGLINLKYIFENIEKRRKLTIYYRNKIDKIPGMKYFVPQDNSKLNYNYAYMPVIIDRDKCILNRDELYDDLKKNKIYTRKYFYPLVIDYGCYKDKYGDSKVPIAKKVANNILCFPLYDSLTYDDIDYIFDSINKIIECKNLKYKIIEKKEISEQRTKLIDYLKDVDLLLPVPISEKVNYNDFLTKIENNGKILCAYNEKNEIIGTIFFYDNCEEAFITLFVIRKEYQNMNVGTKLLQELIDFCNNNHSCIKLYTHKTNFKAIKFYEMNKFYLIDSDRKDSKKMKRDLQEDQ